MGSTTRLINNRDLDALDELLRRRVRRISLTPGGTGPPGPTGPPGIDGSDGADGADGRSIYSGSGVPAGGLGADGDLYLRTSNGDLYAKAAGSWSVVANLVGPTGATGATGATGSAGSAGTAGADGLTVRSGSGAPAGGLGVNGDWYINTAANTIYGPKTAAAWGSPTSLVGPTGATGSIGATGATGSTGAAGAAGASVVASTGAGSAQNAAALNAVATLGTLTLPAGGVAAGDVLQAVFPFTLVQDSGAARVMTPGATFGGVAILAPTGVSVGNNVTVGHGRFRIEGRVTGTAQIEWLTECSIWRGTTQLAAWIETKQTTVNTASSQALVVTLASASSTNTQTATLTHGSLVRFAA